MSSEKAHYVPIKGLVNGMKVVDGVYLPTYMRDITDLRTFRVRLDDTFVLGYPKSGTTWVENIVWLIRNGTKNQEAAVVSSKGWLKSVLIDFGLSHQELEELKSPRIFKTHLLPQFLPVEFEKTAKAIYVVRNPKDLLVSLYHFSQGVVYDEFTGTFEELYELIMDGKYWYAPLWDHINAYALNPNVLVVHYENLLENPKEEIKRLAGFIGRDVDDQELDEIIRLSSFDEMKKSEKQILHQEVEGAIFKKNIKFFRCGKSGQWREYFTNEMAEKMEKRFKKNLKYKGDMHYDS